MFTSTYAQWSPKRRLFERLVFFYSLYFYSGLRPATFLQKRLWHRCFPVNFENFLRAPLLTEHFWWLLLISPNSIYHKNSCKVACLCDKRSYLLSFINQRQCMKTIIFTLSPSCHGSVVKRNVNQITLISKDIAITVKTLRKIKLQTALYSLQVYKTGTFPTHFFLGFFRVTVF